MSIETDILASAVRTTTGMMQKSNASENLGRVRIKAMYAIGTSSAGSCVFRDGNDSGAILLSLPTPPTYLAGDAEIINPIYLILPQNGILFGNGVHVTVTNVSQVLVFYG
jgi:hypothetical protein